MGGPNMALRMLNLLLVTCVCWVQAGCAQANLPTYSADANSVDTVLRNLNRQTSTLKSYQCQIDYRFSQPLLQSQSVRTGTLYYLKSDGRSNLRINFQTLKQDEEKEEKYIEQYIFDGVWLTVIDYQVKEVKKFQLAEPNKPADAFELAANNFPIIGFSIADNLRKNFEISLLEQHGEEHLIGLHLKSKPDSDYKDKYSSADFWIDKKLNLPAKITAVSTEGDIYEIKLLEPKINQPIDKKVFGVEIPTSFGQPQIMLPKKADRK
jgi:outer membrane lipoprotein-sorting protein